MSENTKIQWTDATVNFWTGCRKVSAGCKNCYMFRDMERWGKNPQAITRTKDSTFLAALKWKEPKMIFTCSWSDFFLPEADQWREESWKVIKATPHHTWQILTKRPERIKECLPSDWGSGYKNVWLGTTVENNASLHRIKELSEVPGNFRRFISFEPLLEELDLAIIDLVSIDWAIIGGESGNRTGKYAYRSCEIKWIKSIIDHVLSYSEAAIFVKQLGTHLANEMKLVDKHGGDIDTFPNYLRIRNFPEKLGI